MIDRNEIEVRHIATSVPLPLHRELKVLATQGGLSMSKFFREILVEKLESERKRFRRGQGQSHGKV